MVALLLAWNEDSLEQSFGEQMRKLAAIPAIGLDAIPIFLWDEAGRSDHAFHSMLDQTIMQPEAKTPRLIDQLDGTSPIPIQMRAKRFPSSRDAAAP